MLRMPHLRMTTPVTLTCWIEINNGVARHDGHRSERNGQAA